MAGQLQNWACCQVCGLVTPRHQATADDGWLVSPLRDDPSVDVVRCPRHISEWSLRRSQAGRTRFWRQKMAEGKDTPPPVIPVYLSPFPLHDTPIPETRKR